MLKHRLKVIPHYGFGAVFDNDFEQSTLWLLSVIVCCLPELEKDLLVYFRRATKFRQSLGSQSQLNPTEEHFTEDFWDFQNLTGHWAEFLLA